MIELLKELAFLWAACGATAWLWVMTADGIPPEWEEDLPMLGLCILCGPLCWKWLAEGDDE